jgi:hypothetical protein
MVKTRHNDGMLMRIGTSSLCGKNKQSTKTASRVGAQQQKVRLPLNGGVFLFSVA